MSKLNLCNNDIIVILVIFILFCIFMYINVNNTYEKFQSNDNWRKKEYSDLNESLGEKRRITNSCWNVVIKSQFHFLNCLM